MCFEWELFTWDSNNTQAKLSRRFSEKAEPFYEIKDSKALKELEELIPSTCQGHLGWRALGRFPLPRRGAEAASWAPAPNF